MPYNNLNKNHRYQLDDQRPYPALYPFREEDRSYFFGRESEIKVLAERIRNNVLSVVLGKSGIGKTSLLQAGLIPRLRNEYYLPIYVRIRFDDDKEPPIRQVKTIIESDIKALDNTAISFGDLTLWEYFYNLRIFEGHVKPLLFFDQFEELFTAGKQNPEKVDSLVIEIGDLVQDWIPLSVQEKYKDQGIPYSSKKPDYRVIFSLREEYLPQLKNISRYMPSIVNGRYHFRVYQMKGEDAVDAVLKPGHKIIKDRDVGVKIIEKIPKSKDDDYIPYEEQNGSWKGKKVEPFLLSLFCYKINEKRLESSVGEISAELLKEVEAKDIIEDFYEKNINQFQSNVKIAIENLLLTDEGHRKLQDLDLLKTDYGITDKDIEGLVARRIIRRETRIGIEYIELIHDVLTPILKENRDKRKEEEKRKQELAERKKKYSRIIVAIIGVAAIFLALLTVYAFQQKAIAEKQGRNNKAYELAARSTNLLDKDSTLSFRLAEYAYRTEKTNPDAYQALLNAYHSSDSFQEIIKYEGKLSPKHSTDKSVFFAALSPDGSRILTVDENKAILWHLDGSKIKKFKEGKPKRGDGSTNDFELNPNAAFSPDGKYIVFCTDKEGKIALWNLEGEEITSLKLKGGVNSVAFYPDKASKKILTANRDNRIRLLDLKGSLLSPFKGDKEMHKGEVKSAVFSRDGKYIVTASWDNTARLWDLDGKEIKVFKGHKKAVNFASFSHDGKYIVTASSDGTARMLDLKGNQLQVFEGHKEAVKSAVFSPDGKYIITGSVDQTARVWNLNGIRVYEFKGFIDIIHFASFSPDGKYVLIVPAKGQAQYILIDPGEIISNVNRAGVWQLDEETKKKYSLMPREF